MEGLNLNISHEEAHKETLEQNEELKSRQEQLEEAQKAVKEMFDSKMEARGVTTKLQNQPYFESVSERRF